MTTIYTAAVYKLDRLLAVETFTSYNAVMAFSGAMAYKGYTVFAEDERGNDLRIQTVPQYRAYHRSILMDLGVWKRMTTAERDEFDLAETKELIDRLQVRFRRMYF